MTSLCTVWFLMCFPCTDLSSIPRSFRGNLTRAKPCVFLICVYSFAIFLYLWKENLLPSPKAHGEEATTLTNPRLAYCSQTGIHPSLSKHQRVDKRSEGNLQTKLTHAANKEPHSQIKELFYLHANLNYE